MKKLTAFILCIMMMLTLVLSASAFELDVAENDVTETAEEAALASTTEPLINKQYGKLILFKDFEQENADHKAVAYFDSDYMTGSTTNFADVNAKSVVDDPKGEKGKVLSVTGTGWVQTFIDFQNLRALPGKYQMVYDYYSADSATSLMERYFTNINHSGGTGVGDYISVTPGGAPINKTAWVTKVYNNTLVVENLADGTGVNMTYGNVATKPYYHTADNQVSITRAGIMPNKSSMTYYLDNIKLYYFPANAVVFANGDSLKMVEYNTETVTLPVPSAVDGTWSDTNFKFWEADGKYYKAGETYPAGEILGKSFTLLAFEEPLYDENKGDLILLFNYEGKDGIFAPTYMNPEYFTVKPTIELRADSINSNRGLTTEEDGNKVIWGSFTNKGVYLFGYTWNNGVAPAAELITFDFDYKIVEGVEAFAGRSFWTRFCGALGGEVYNGGVNVSHSGEAGKWYSVSTSKNGITAGTHTNGAVPQVGTKAIAEKATVYYDNIAFYVKPASFSFKSSADGEIIKTITMKDNTSTYTFPKPEDLGLDSTNFIAWSDGKGNIFEAGETADFTNKSNFRGSEFYPFSQAADMPAVISLFEGEKEIEVSKDSYAESIDDDGRDVLYSHYWGTTWSENEKRWTNDPRIYMYAPERFNANEYGIIEIMSKCPWAYSVTDSKNPDSAYVEKTEYEITIYNCINEGHTYVGGSRLCTTAFPISDEYNLLSLNAAQTGSTYPWGDTGWGFVVDINNALYGADTYVDYVRVYRSGITTVTYDTNAPEGVEETAILKEVEPDTGRGLGTGYLLKDLRPEIEGYVFKGWATSADSTETVESIDLTGNTTVYAVWDKADKYITTEMLEDTEIKGTGSNNGIRFKSIIKPSFKANLDEFGFLATREVLLPKLDGEAYDYSALTFDHRVKGEKANYYVQGIAYDKDKGTDVVNSETDDGDIVYTTVLSGIPLEKKAETMVVRPYAQYEINGKAVTIYGEVATGSLYDTAMAIRTAGGEAYENNKTYIESIVADAE